MPQIAADEIKTVYAVPRLITLEHRLTQQCNENRPLKNIFQLIQEALPKQNRLSDDIDGPFHFARITRDGFTRLDD